MRDPGPRCRICGGGLELAWRLPVLRGAHEAEYHRCRRCEALQVPNPTWLAEAYRGEKEPPSADDRDTGRFRRNYSAYLYLRALIEAGITAAEPRVLDFGGGYGLLTQMLVDAGLQAFTADAHVPRPFFAPDRVVADLRQAPAAAYDVVTALEVFEHLLEPLDVADALRKVLKPGGTLVLSTEVYRPSVHGADWGYLATEGGQHVTFWSERALDVLAQHMRFASVGFFPGDLGFLIVLSPLDEGDLQARLTRAKGLLDQPDFLQRVLLPWDFRHSGVIPPETAPVTRAVDPQPRS